MKVLHIICIAIVSFSLTGCINYRVGNDVHDPTVMAAKTGKDCAAMLMGLGLESAVNQAMKSGGITKVRALYDTNTSLLGIGRYCHFVVGE
jgi:hypothetical protein